ncbi:MAG: aspartate kinase [Clostridia bacterium]|nr:aspartate kinase [Clostridia bacterium]
MELKVCKFGGTSMATKDSILNVANIVNADSARKFVVVSAPGKRFKGDDKVTDLLYACYSKRDDSNAFETTFKLISDRFITIAKELNIKYDISVDLRKVHDGILENNSIDYAASRGEYLSAILFSKVLGFEFVDAADIIKFDSEGDFDPITTNELIASKLSFGKGAVIPGFYGSLPDGTIKTFSRGGSDYTGSLIAKGVEADIYENWTDVSGFCVADPRIVNDPKIINELSYDELRELSYMGASVLHPASTFPLQSLGIPINIKNTFDMDAEGTMIVKTSTYKKASILTGIAGKKGFTTIFIKKDMMNTEVGFVRKVLSVIEKYNINLEHMPTGIDTMSLIVPTDEIDDKLEYVISDISKAVNPGLIYVYKNISLIAVVGHGMLRTAGTAAKIFSALADANINIRMIDQGSSEINIIIGVDETNMDKAIKTIYNKFFN